MQSTLRAGSTFCFCAIGAMTSHRSRVPVQSAALQSTEQTNVHPSSESDDENDDLDELLQRFIDEHPGAEEASPSPSFDPLAGVANEEATHSTDGTARATASPRASTRASQRSVRPAIADILSSALAGLSSRRFRGGSCDHDGRRDGRAGGGASSGRSPPSPVPSAPRGVERARPSVSLASRVYVAGASPLK